MAIEQIGITTEYKADGLGETKPVLRIGGKTEKFVPNINISFALESSKEQFFLNINRTSVTVDKEASTLASEKLALTIGNETDIWHIDENGHLKWDIEFAQKPPTNKFLWALTHTEGLEFYPQPALTQADIDRGSVRPDNVVGSYAVYCNKSGHYKSSDGKTIVNYGPGKLLHIYRPLCIDAKGKKEWAELLIEKGTLTITIPQKYLDSAEYPVTLDPTFGYTSVGATIGSTTDNACFFELDTNPSSDGTVTTCHFHGEDWPITTDEIQIGLYSDSLGTPNSRLGYDAFNDHYIDDKWYVNDTDLSIAITSGTTYWLGITKIGAYFSYDSGGSKTNRSSTSTTLPASAGTTTQDYSSAHFSAYATYTEAAGGASVTLSNPFSRPFQQSLGRGGF